MKYGLVLGLVATVLSGVGGPFVSELELEGATVGDSVCDRNTSGAIPFDPFQSLTEGSLVQGRTWLLRYGRAEAYGV